MLHPSTGRRRRRGLHRSRVAVLGFLAAALFVVAEAPPASAHALISYITLTAEGEGPAVVVTAEVRYPDHDVVRGETVVGVAWSPATQQVVPLTLTAVPGRDGRWEAQTKLAPGPWKVEVDAVKVTRGLQSVGFTVATSGPPSAVVSPSPLPASVAVPQAPAETDAAGLRTAPATGASGATVIIAALLVVVGAAVPVMLLRRRSAGEQAQQPEQPEQPEQEPAGSPRQES